MDLCVWDKCNNKCLMCTNPKDPWPARDGSFNYDYEAIISRLVRYKDEINSSATIYLSGGEPTLHPHFLAILKYIKNNFSNTRVILLSNGRRFFYEDFAKEVLSVNRNFEIDVSLCGHNDKIHDNVTRSPGSFYQAREGLKNLLKYKRPGQKIGIRHVLDSLTYKHVYNFLNLIHNDFSIIDRVALIFWEIEAMALENFKKLKIAYKQASPYLQAILKFDKKIKDIRLYHFPLCVLPVPLWPNVWRTLPEEEVVFLPKCSLCQYKENCLGIPRQYMKKIGKKEFKPIIKSLGVIVDKKDKHNPIK